MSSLLNSPLIPGAGIRPTQIRLLLDELNIRNYEDLIQHFPFRYEDRSVFHTIGEVLGKTNSDVQLLGRLQRFSLIRSGRRPQLAAEFSDSTGTIRIIWFQGHRWVLRKFSEGEKYVLYGKLTEFKRIPCVVHPELTSYERYHQAGFVPVYNTTEGMKKSFLSSKILSEVIQKALKDIKGSVEESLPQEILGKYNFPAKGKAFEMIHIPGSLEEAEKARNRLKYEEIFFHLLRGKMNKKMNMETPGIRMSKNHLLTEYFNHHLPFDLTGAQKRVIREIWQDMKSGLQMNRLIHGDVGCGKTMVAFFALLMAISNDTQAAFMAPTEILARQHYFTLFEFCSKLDIEVAFLSGSTVTKERRRVLKSLEEGRVNILVGTHALIQDAVHFNRLGLVVIDEQHRFGVRQRALLRDKNMEENPHLIVMTATPIPRTLAMSQYGDLSVSLIDELPKGRQPIETYTADEQKRARVFRFVKSQIESGHQAYIVYPLIEESADLDLRALMEGAEAIRFLFPDTPISVVHGKLKAEEKEREMIRFKKDESKIMVATTVIEVGVDVPNATVMMIENAERFGLSQLHQMRGRIGRGSEKSYCILMHSIPLSEEARKRLKILEASTDGFEIAEKDLLLRGPGDLLGTKQSGLDNFLLMDLKDEKDQQILFQAHRDQQALLARDKDLEDAGHQILRVELRRLKSQRRDLGSVS